MTRIETDRLIIRPPTLADAEQLHDIFSHADAMQYWSTLPHTDLSQTIAYIEGVIALPSEQGEDFVVEHNGIVIGKAGFWRFPEIGYIFHPDSWGKGIASEAVGALLEHGFGQCKLTKVIADVDPRNAGSIRMLEKLGFHETHRKTETIKIGDQWFDSIYFAKTAPKT